MLLLAPACLLVTIQSMAPVNMGIIAANIAGVVARHADGKHITFAMHRICITMTHLSLSVVALSPTAAAAAVITSISTLADGATLSDLLRLEVRHGVLQLSRLSQWPRWQSHQLCNAARLILKTNLSLLPTAFTAAAATIATTV